jgi:ABC-type Fe3+-hydroxamate transport system substrate-binding protein
MKLVGYTDIDDSLRRLGKVTQKEALVVAAQALDAAHRFHDEVIHIANKVQGVEGRVKCLEGKNNPICEILDGAQPCSMNFMCITDI